MTRSVWTFTGPEGTPATPANTGASIIQNTGSATAVMAAATKGVASGFGLKVTTGVGGASTIYGRWVHSVTTALGMGGSAVLLRPATLPTTTVALGRVRGASTVLTLNYNTAGSLVVTDAGGANTTLATAAQLDAAGITAGSVFRWRPRVVAGTTTSNGQHASGIYSLTGTLAGAVGTSSTANVGTAPMTALELGLTNSATPGGYSGGVADVVYEDFPGPALPAEVADAPAPATASPVLYFRHPTSGWVDVSGQLYYGNGSTWASVTL